MALNLGRQALHHLCCLGTRLPTQEGAHPGTVGVLEAQASWLGTFW